MPKSKTTASTITKKKAAVASGAKTKKKTTKKSKVKISAFGNYGKQISFIVSSSKQLTFTDFQREGEARWKKHELIKKVPKMEFLGPGSETISMTIVLDARHGVKPRKTIDKIRACRNKGKADYLVLGGKKIGKNKWVITKTSDTWNEVWNKGELVRATLELSFQEYR